MNARSNLVGKDTRQGPSRERNQDHLGTPPEWIEPAVLQSKGRLYVVADGMGGHAAGEEASRRAVSRVFHEYYADPSTDVGRSLERAISLANAEIYQQAQQNAAFKGMGTTITAAVLRGTDLHVANVGDSRAYLVRAGVAQQLTEDHSLVMEQVRSGALTLEQARVHPKRNVITRSLGGKPSVRVDHFQYQLQPGDRVLLCTDGLSGVVEDRDLARVVAGAPDPGRAVKDLLNLADRQGRHDDAAVIVMGMPGAGAGPGARPVGRPVAIPVAPLAAVAVLALVAIFAYQWFSRSRPQPTAIAVVTDTPVPTTPPPAIEGVPTATPVTTTPTLGLAATSAPTTGPVATTPPPFQTTLEEAPILQGPKEGDSVTSRQITFQWSWAHTLEDEEQFDVRMFGKGARHDGVARTEERRLDYYNPIFGGGEYCWSVEVIRVTGPDPQADWEAVSEESEVWCFTYSPPEPSDTPRATPAPTNTSQPTWTEPPPATWTPPPPATPTSEPSLTELRVTVTKPPQDG